MKYFVGFFSLALALSASPVPAGAKVKIASVPSEFRPYSGPGLPQAVSMSGFYFEVNEETGRARVVVDYTYENEAALSSDDHHRPDPSYVQINGLTYDRSARSVVYTHDGERQVCATVERHTGLLRAKLSVKSTGNCMVTAETTDHAEDNGWSIQHFRAVDVYFEVR